MSDQQRAHREAEFFDRFAAEHGEYDVLGEGAYRRLVAMFKDLVQPRPGERCADLGCGTGAFTARLGGFGLLRTGIDISASSIARAEAQGGEVRYLVGDITQTQLPNESFDIILYSGVLHHFSTPAQRKAVLKEGFRLLSRGGRLFAYDPSVQSPAMFLYRDPRSPLFSDKGKTENEVLLHRSALAGELREAGFTQITIRGVSGISFCYVESKLAGLLLPLYNLYEQVVRYSPFENLLGTFLVSVAKK